MSGGMLLVNDAEVTVADMEALDEHWECTWLSDGDYGEAYTGGGAKIVTCKTGFEKTDCPILASYDADDQPVAIHIDFCVHAAAQAADRNSSSRATRWGAAAGRMLPWLFRSGR